MSNNRILILEDDVTMASELQIFLNNQGYVCDVVNDGALLFKTDIKQYNLFLLDVDVACRLLNQFACFLNFANLVQ